MIDPQPSSVIVGYPELNTLRPAMRSRMRRLTLKATAAGDERTPMWKEWILTALIPLSGICLANPPTPAVPINPDQAEIRTARATYNKALASRDAETISRYWLLDSQSVWANGKLTVGMTTSLRAMRRRLKTAISCLDFVPHKELM